MHADFLLNIFRENSDSVALVWQGESYSYQWLLDRCDFWTALLLEEAVLPGAVVALEADFSPDAAAAMIALIQAECVAVPMTVMPESQREELRNIAQCGFLLRIEGAGNYEFHTLQEKAQHPYYETLRKTGHPGLVLFSSGSSGKSKAAVHDFSRLLQKFQTRRHNLRTMAFLLFDHIGGIDTLFYSLSNGSCLITIEDRSPDSVCELIAKHRVEVLPVSPTFLNMLLLRQSYLRYDLSSLKYITYGAEVMPAITLQRCAELFPGVTMLQKYGTTEVGTLRSKSRSSDSLWMKIGGEGYQTRIVDGILQIKAESAMLGYLNAPSPFTEDGWFNTQDAVETDGDYVKILGRESDIINVGGDKVYPAEVEAAISLMDDIVEATVFSESNPIIGNIVCARVSAVEGTDEKTLPRRIKKHCRELLEPHKIPLRIKIVQEDQHVTSRFKKNRN
ncbi:MAG: long-chain fatty acid--CoA ligase [Calditrichia bacterium]